MPFYPMMSRVAFAFSLLICCAGAQSPVSPIIPGRFIVTYRDGMMPASPRTAGARVVEREARLGIAVVQSGAGAAAATLGQLKQDPAVESVVADRMVRAHALTVQAVPAPSAARSDALYYGAQGWAVRQVGGFGSTEKPGPWSTTTGAGVRIAILDTGVDASHPDLAPNVVLGISEVDQSAATGVPSACDDGTPVDQVGHGSWTASLAAGALGAGTGQVAGVAPSASILNIKVLQRMPGAATADDPTGCNAGQGGGLLSWLIHGIEDAVANRADVISMSLGVVVDISSGDGAALQAMMNRVTHAAFSAGAVLVAAAGNDGLNFDSAAARRLVSLPAQSRDVLAIVAATNPDCMENLAPGAGCTAGAVTRPYYSNYGSGLNALAAPGGSYPRGADGASSGWVEGACSNGITSTVSGVPADTAHSYGCFGLGHATYVQAMGTSAAAPLAAGAAALLRAAHPAWDAATVVSALRSSAQAVATLPVPEVNVAGLLTPVRP